MPAAPRLPQVGDLFGRYRVEAQIGRGGMGVVFRATDTAIDRTVALKVVSSALGDTDEFRTRFEREAAVLARLASPHVIEIYDYGTHDDCPYIATQYVGGGDLGALLHERGPMPPALALRVCAQVADALHDAHRVGVVHRDVKPTNVLLRDATTVDLHAYLCDFGIARTATDGLTAPGAVAGTWSYLAPECGRGAPGTPSSDVYALGCLLWATLTGAPPYRGSDVEVAVAHQRAPIPQLAGTDELSGRVNAVLRRAMAKDPADRHPDADTLRVALLEAAGVASAAGARALPAPGPAGHPSLAATVGPSSGSRAGSRPGSRPGPPPSRRRRTRLTIAAVVAAVLVVVGGLVTATALTRDDDSPTAGATSSPPTTGATSAATDPTSAPTTPGPTGPVRVDRGGPVTGDLDGDGLGDLRVSFSRTSRTDDHSGDFIDVTDWASDGSRFVRGETAATPESAARDQDVTGDFDGDDVLETLVVRNTLEALRVARLFGPLSGGGRIDTTFEKEKDLAFLASGDVDGDGSDDLRLLYVAELEAPIRVASVLLDGSATRTTAPLARTFASYGDATYSAGDYDGDGRDDLAAIELMKTGPGPSQYRTELALWFGGRDGGLSVGPRTTVRDVGYGRQLLSADLDGDEDQELVVVSGEGVGALSGYDLRGRRLRAPAPLGALGSVGQDLAVAASDVDGDGLDDLAAVVVDRDARARLLVARNAGDTLTVTRWAVWDRRFNSTRMGSYISPLGGPFE